MTTQTEALKLAQKALSNKNAPAKMIYEALHAIEKALAQPEPVVFCMHWEDRWGCNHYVDQKEPHPINAKPLYTSPQH